MINKVFNMDCMEYMKSIPDNFFDLAVVDPPYGINATKMNMGTNMNRKIGGYNGESVAQRLRKGRLNQGAEKLKNRKLNTLSCDWDYSPPGEAYFNELFRVSRNQVIWGGNYFNLPPTRGILCWDKMQPWENFSQFELAWTSFDCPAAIIHLSNTGGANKETKIHPTQKPIKLYQWVFEKFAKPGYKIFDTHLGSGSSRIAAYKMGIYFNLPPTRGILCWDKMQPWENFSQFELAWTSFDCPAAIIHLSNTGGANKETKIHPTQKPIKLYQWVFEKFAKPGYKIFDTHLGSGSSRIAAYKMGIDFYGTEIDESYFSESQKRFDKECLNTIILPGGEKIIQQELFK